MTAGTIMADVAALIHDRISAAVLCAESVAPALLAQGDITGDRFWGGLLGNGVAAIVGGVIASFITVRILNHRVGVNETRLNAHRQRLDKHQAALNTLHTDRIQCQSQARMDYASQSQIMQLIAQDERQNAELKKNIDHGMRQIHGRMDEMHGRMNDLCAALLSQPPHPPGDPRS